MEVQSAVNYGAVSSITGSWKLAETEKITIDNQTVWEAVPSTQSFIIIFRNDGVILNEDEKPLCCAPTSLIINDQLLEIKPQSPIPANKDCELVNCINCPTWEIELIGNQMIIKACNKARMKYVR